MNFQEDTGGARVVRMLQKIPSVYPERRHHRKDGQEVVVHGSCSPKITGGNPEIIHGMFYDVTRKRKKGDAARP